MQHVTCHTSHVTLRAPIPHNTFSLESQLDQPALCSAAAASTSNKAPHRTMMKRMPPYTNPWRKLKGRGNASQPNKASRPFKLRVQTQRSIYELKNASPSTSCISHTMSRFTPGFQPNLANKLPRQQHCRCCAAYARLCRSPCKQHTVAAPPAHSSTHTSIWQTSSNRVGSCFFRLYWSLQQPRLQPRTRVLIPPPCMPNKLLFIQ